LLIFKSYAQISIHWMILCGRDSGTLYITIRNTRTEQQLPCYRYGMICHRSSLIRQSCHFETDFIVCCCSWWTFWTPSFNREDSGHSSPKRLNCWRKNCKIWYDILLNI